MKKIIGLIFVVFFWSCSSITESDKSQKALQTGKLSIAFHKNSVPDMVTSIQGTLTRNDFDSIPFRFESSEDSLSIKIDSLVFGAWNLFIEAIGDSGTVYYDGQTIIDIIPGETVKTFLNLNPKSGNVEITVNWGTPRQPINNDLIFYTTNNDIYSSKFDGSSLQKLNYGLYPIWLNNKSEYAFVENNTIKVYTLKDNQLLNTTTPNNFPYNVMHIRYSNYYEKFAFVYQNSGYKIGLLDRFGSVETVLEYTHNITNPTFNNEGKVMYFIEDINSDGVYETVSSYDLLKAEKETIYTASSGGFYGNFSADYNGEKLVLPKVNSDNSLSISIIDIQTKSENLISIDHINSFGYTSVTRDNKYILFSSSGHIYRINFDGTNIQKVVDGSNTYFYRALTW